MTCRIVGEHTWDSVIDDDGNAEYHLTVTVESDDPNDGPKTVSETPGLPVTGSIWELGNDVDPNAYCRFNARFTPERPGTPSQLWKCQYTYSQKPSKRCQDEKVTDPLLEPQKLSGGFNKTNEEAVYNRFGRVIRTSSHEQVRGNQVEFDRGRPTVRLVQNVPGLGWAVLCAAQDTVNIYPLWGLPARCIKLSNISWERQYYGQCSIYFTRTLEFEVNVKRDPTTGELVSGWDRDIVDEGTKVLNGRWDSQGRYVLVNINGQPPNAQNPQHFIRAKDRNGENIQLLLNGGLPAGVQVIGTGGVYVVTSTALTNPTTQADFAIAVQPSTPSQLEIIIAFDEDTCEVASGEIHVVGKDANGVDLSESFSIVAPITYQTQGEFASVGIPADPNDPNSVALSPDYTNFALTAASTTGVTVSIRTITEQLAAGNIHVEKYDEVDFLSAFGVPIDLDLTIAP